MILTLASLGMAMSGQIDAQLMLVAAACLPVTLGGAWIGARVYRGFSEESFRRIVLALLLASGLILVAQAFG